MVSSLTGAKGQLMGPSDFTREDAVWMRRCHELAAKAAAEGNTPVGSLILLGGEVLAEASEDVPVGPDAFAHAELIAVREALRLHANQPLTGATLYTTAEPCFMCSYAIRKAKISRVVMGRPTPGTGGATSRYPILTAPNIEGWHEPPVLVWGRTKR